MQGLTERSIQCELESADPFAVPGHDPSPPEPHALAIARDLLATVLRYRRASATQAPCPALPCQKCALPHLSKVHSAVALRLPVTFVLPGFPGKSPNPANVLGTLPA